MHWFTSLLTKLIHPNIHPYNNNNRVVDKLHAAGIPVMNMIGAPKHVKKALDAGVDIICAQGGEGGGHTGDVATSILIPKVRRWKWD